MDQVNATIIKVRAGFTSLQGSPCELWTVYVLKFLECYSYFSFSIICTLFLSDEFGYSDIAAGSLYGAWGSLVTVYGILGGWIVDHLGVAISLKLGFFLSLLSRAMIFWTTSRAVVLANMCGLLPLANCLGIPVLSTGIQRYTTELNRGFAFGLFYVSMNLAALVSGPVVDGFTIWYNGNNGNANIQDDPTIWSWTSHRIVLLTGIIANAVACCLTISVREIKVEDCFKSTKLGCSLSSKDDDSSCSSAHLTSRISQFEITPGTPMQFIEETIRKKSFWRFLAVCIITLNVRMIFRHLDATLPKYMLREFGEDVPKGTIYSLNPALIVVLVPILTAWTPTVDPLVMIHHGSYISAASVFVLAISTSVTACAAFISILSVGEAMWSPRLYDYTMSMVQEGREGTYTALSLAPLFLAKLPVGFMSGYLLHTYCPEEGDRHSKTMWLVIGLTTAASPILMTIFWKYISSNEDSDEDAYAITDEESAYKKWQIVENNLDGLSSQT